MSGGGDQPKTYRSPFLPATDQLGAEQIISLISGVPIAPSPSLNSFYVAQALGGTYDAKREVINMPDGSQLRYDPLLGEFVSSSKQSSKILDNYAKYLDASGKPFQSAAALQAYVNSGGGVFKPGKGKDQTTGLPAKPVQVSITAADLGGTSQYLDQANDLLKNTIEPNAYGPNSAYSLFGNEAFGKTVYDPETGTYVPEVEGQMPKQLTGDTYLQKYGDYLNKPYEQFQPEAFAPYQQFDYTGTEIPTVDNIDEALVDKQIARQQDEINQNYQASRKNIDEFVAQSGGSLNSGRAARLVNSLDLQAGTDRAAAADKARTDQALRSFYDAAHVRDLNAAQKQTNLGLRGEEARYAYDTAAQGAAAGQQIKREEAQKAFDIGQQQGKERLAIGSATDSDQANRAAQQQQSNQQTSLNRITALQNMLGIYAGLEGTYGQLAAAQAAQQNSALSGLFQGLGGLGQTAAGIASVARKT